MNIVKPGGEWGNHDMAGINYISPSYMYKKNNLNMLQPQRFLEKGSDLHTFYTYKQRSSNLQDLILSVQRAYKELIKSLQAESLVWWHLNVWIKVTALAADT